MLNRFNAGSFLLYVHDPINIYIIEIGLHMKILHILVDEHEPRLFSPKFITRTQPD